MRNLISFLLFVAVTSVSLGQETKFISRGAETGGIEEYYVLKADKKVKHGTYVRYLPPFGTRDYVILESGSYANGEKQGVWEYYYSNGLQKSSWNKLREKGAYVNGKKNGVWTSFYLDTTTNVLNKESYGNKKKTDSVNIFVAHKNNKLKQAGMYLNDKRVGEWVSYDYYNRLIQKYDFKEKKLLFEKSINDSLDYNLNRKPLFIGGVDCLTEFLYHNYKSTSVLIDKDSTYVTIAFTINANGGTQEHRIIRSSRSKDLEKEMLRLISSTDSNWLPAIENGQTKTFEYKIGIDIIRYPDSGQNRRFKSFFTILE
jgi:antitoxin component YwqK of YwqJK toxin-antitoxin module